MKGIDKLPDGTRNVMGHVWAVGHDDDSWSKIKLTDDPFYFGTGVESVEDWEKRKEGGK